MKILVGVQLDDWRFSLSVFLDAGIRRAWRTPRHRRSVDHVPRQGRRTHISNCLYQALSQHKYRSSFARSCRRKKPPGRAVRLSRATADSTSGSAAFLGKKPDDFLAIRQVWGGNAHGKATGRRERRIRNFTISFIRHNPSTGSSRSRIHETRTILKKNDAVCGGELKVVEKESRQHPERHGRVCGARVRPWPRSIMRRNQKRAC